MAKIVITIEDMPEGRVKVVSDPSFEVMAKRDLSGHDLTSAHGYAFCALNAIRKASKEQALSAKIPRIKLL